MHSGPDKARQRQTRTTGGLPIALGLLMPVFPVPDPSGVATFGLSRPTDVRPMPNLNLPGGALLYVVAALLTLLGLRQFLRGLRNGAR